MAKGNRQVGALPMKRDADGRLLALLVTSRETRRWVIPKGWPWPGLADHLAAAEEAWEEAGVRGTPGNGSLGSYTYNKNRRSGPVPLTVSVFPLEVVDEFETWPEQDDRQRAWFLIEDAIALVREPELQDLLRQFIVPVQHEQ